MQVQYEYKITFQFKADRPPKYVFCILRSYDLDIDAMTLILDLDLIMMRNCTVSCQGRFWITSH